MNYFVLITPLVAGAIAVYGIFPDLLVRGASSRRKAFAGFLILLAAITSIRAAYTAYSEQKYLSSWRAIEDIHDGVGRVWRDFQKTIFDSDRIEKGEAALGEAQELIKQGRLKEAEAKTKEARAFMASSQPDKEKLKKVAGDIHKLMTAANRSGISHDLKFRTFLFCVTLETLVRRHSTHKDLQPLDLFAEVMKDKTSWQTDKVVFGPEWSELLWSIGYFRPSDFGPPSYMLSVDNAGRVIVDHNKFDEDFLVSRATFLLDWFESVAR